MKRKEKMVGFILGIITGAADGPTAIFIAGKIDFTPVYIGTAILVLIMAGYMLYRKNKKGGS